MKLSELATREFLTNSQLKLFKDDVVFFSTDNEYMCSRMSTQQGDWHDAITRVWQKVFTMHEQYPILIFTGHHTENDWAKTSYWWRGWHYVNRTGDFAVVKLSCRSCAYRKDCTVRGDLVTWCKSYATDIKAV
jgi:hypothetical protein